MQDDSDDAQSGENQRVAESRKSSKNRINGRFGKANEDTDMGNIFSFDKNKMELLNNLNSLKLLNIDKKFNQCGDQNVTVQEFIEIMAEELKDSPISHREDFIQ